MTCHSEIVKLRVNKQDLLESNLENYEIIAIDEPRDYSKDEIWQALSKQSRKAYKELKNREYDLRHEKNQQNQ